MMRLMGAVLVAAGGAALGFQAAASLQKRGRAVRQMEEEMMYGVWKMTDSSAFFISSVMV